MNSCAHITSGEEEKTNEEHGERGAFTLASDATALSALRKSRGLMGLRSSFVMSWQSRGLHHGGLCRLKVEMHISHRWHRVYELNTFGIRPIIYLMYTHVYIGFHSRA